MNLNLRERFTPFVTGRAKRRKQLFKDNKYIGERVRYREMLDEKMVSWYTVEELMKRRPDYITVNSLYYRRFLGKCKKKDYPSLCRFFKDLLNEKYPYHIVFDRESAKVPQWIYPSKIDFLHNRIVILKKNAAL